MPKKPAMKMVKVELYMRVPSSLSSPQDWDWNAIVNYENDPKKHSPVEYVIAVPVQEGTA